MKDFFKYTLATITGLIVFSVIAMIFLFTSIVGIMVAKDSGGTIEDNSVLVINLKGEIRDHASDEADVMSMVLGESNQALGLDQLSDAIKNAKSNDNVKGIYIEAGQIEADPATLTALRREIEDFRKSKKFVVAYADQYSQGAYYIASAADKVWINPQGMLAWHGLAAQPRYLRDFLAKVGVKMQVVKVGVYKSATETYTEDHMSDANREQVSIYLNGIWQQMVNDICTSRKMKPETLNAYADEVMDLASAQTLLDHKLVDALLYEDQVKGEVKKLLKIADDEDVPQVGVATMASSKDFMESSDNIIAVYHCEGSIVQEAVQGALMGDAGIIGPDVCADLRKLANDDNIKAVVIRINSGGGDAYASEQMWHQIKELKKKKPVVVSMGGMAASGGYYMSCGANWIVAEPTTLTGSIGIFGVFPDASNLMTEKLGFHYDEVKTNRHSSMSMLAMARPFGEDEVALLQSYIDRGYDTFISRVAEGRKMTKESVNNIAQGRVWLGKDALKLKLVDQIGSLDDAITKASALAKVKDHSTEHYPTEGEWIEKFAEKTKGNNYLSEQLRLTLGEYFEPFMLMKTIRQQSPVQARCEYVFKIKD